MQAASDLFLGWGNNSEGRSYYFRQLRDMKLSVDVSTMTLSELNDYSRLCSWALARAHAKAGDAAMISGYLGSGDSFDEAVARFALHYAEQVNQDFQILTEAAQSGRIHAVRESDFSINQEWTV